MNDTTTPCSTWMRPVSAVPTTAPSTSERAGLGEDPGARGQGADGGPGELGATEQGEIEHRVGDPRLHGDESDHQGRPAQPDPSRVASPSPMSRAPAGSTGRARAGLGQDQPARADVAGEVVGQVQLGHACV
jgi:hypothetical protein